MKKCALFFIFSLVIFKCMALEIKSDVFDNGGYLPDRYTPSAQNFSPLLFWSDVPANTESFALICEDPDAPFKVCVHWVLYDIPKETSVLKENISDQDLADLGIKKGTNDFGKIGYQGPCPPQGKSHKYIFKLYALDKAIGLGEGANKKDVIEAIQGHILAEAKTTAIYQKPKDSQQ
ncbi:MAG: YbhB/YbcL family Raf kinase inhibitor-like protein [Candidatus Omnitrophica bacterium]|nr:YbhB/YbcL family Raf kinase inhibitor-like protein [Candidatus Omnitrophota bacterium]MDD5429560.1 YbhB/YbcL family Raf kinase inhibitor-like protein [Candidatus Omnitrophota bacterium]